VIEAKTNTAAAIRIRDADADDTSFVLLTAKRLTAFDLPRWRAAGDIWSAESRTLRQWFDNPSTGTLLVAERGGARIGFVFLERHIDYFTQEEHGHVSILAVTETAEGTGAGRALLDAAECWARSRGYGCLTLNVFEGNHRARAVYARLGFAPETLRYVKELR
jgi:GNAT superfamily N-acetyltransferase